MGSRYDQTLAALDHFDRVDQPALVSMENHFGRLVLEDFNEARRAAADRVRAAFLGDTRGDNTTELVELLSVDAIRRMVGGTVLGRLLSHLP